MCCLVKKTPYIFHHAKGSNARWRRFVRREFPYTFSCSGRAMICFIPKKDCGELPLSQGITPFPEDESLAREGGRGHVINIAREYICIFKFEDELAYGRDSALMIAAEAAGCGISMPEGEESHAVMRAFQNGVLRIDEETLRRIHERSSVRFTTLGNNQAVVKGQMVASVQIVSRTAGDLRVIEKICRECRPIIDVLPVHSGRTGS